MNNGLKTKTVTIDKGRDAGKKFKITEMPAIQADEWAHRLVYEAAKSGLDLKNVDVLNLDTKSMKGMIEIGAMVFSILGRIEHTVSREMKFELLDKCVRIIPTGGEARECDWSQEINEATTFTVLAGHVIGLHVDFLMSGDS